MFAMAHTIPVNPDGAEPVLTQAQVWRGLEMKAEDAKPFVTGMAKCDLVERTGNVLVRDISFAGKDHRERVTLTAPSHVHFERVGEAGFIENTLSTSDDGLMLTFMFALQFPGTEPGSPEEQAKGEEMRGAYVGAIAATLARVRQMARDGEL